MWLVFPQVVVAGILPPLSGTLTGAQCSGEGWARGRATIQSTLFCFFALCLLRPKKMPGLLIISVLNGLFKTGHVKVRGLEINHTDSSFPPVELVAMLVIDGSLKRSIATVNLQYFNHCKKNQNRIRRNRWRLTYLSPVWSKSATAEQISQSNSSPMFRQMWLIERNECMKAL